MNIKVDFGNGDVAVLDELTPSRQGLLLVLMDGRVILVPLSYDDATEVAVACLQGKIVDLAVRPPYSTWRRCTIH